MIYEDSRSTHAQHLRRRVTSIHIWAEKPLEESKALSRYEKCWKNTTSLYLKIQGEPKILNIRPYFATNN